jgi:hypothetical protein
LFYLYKIDKSFNFNPKSIFHLSNLFRCKKPPSSKKNPPGRNSKQKPLNTSEDETTKRSSKRTNARKQKFEDDPYIADDEDEDYNGKKRRSLDEKNRLVMKVVKQGDYQHKHSFNGDSGGLGDIEQDFFLPRNLTLYDRNSEVSLKSALRSRQQQDYDESFESDSDFDDEFDENKARTKAVFEMPRKPLANFSKWSRWSKCSPKCVTKRFKKCRPHARQICGNEVIREIAYCYTEGSFCEEWISSQITKISEYNKIEAPKPTTKAPRPARRTESPLSNSVSQNFYGSNGASKKNPKQKHQYKPQNFQCGFPSIRNKNSDFALKIIGGKTSRRAAVKIE